LGRCLARFPKTSQNGYALLVQQAVITVTRASISRTTTAGGGASGGAKDPRFSYCYQATAAGYGPYYRSRDAEYYFFTDGDSDGIVCE